jgi:hypothetical protein
MEINSFQIIDRVCTLLKNKYIIEYPIYDCMFHVHISKGIDGDFGYKLNRNMFAFLWAIEFQIDKFHPVEIVTSEDECKQPLHSPWNDVVGAMKERASNNNPMTALEAIDKILNCKTGNEVIDMMTHSWVEGDMKYNTLSLATPDLGRWEVPGISINLHEATLDIKRIENWVRVCMEIVRFLDSFDDDFTYFEDFIRGVPDGKTYSPEDLLTDIGLPELIEFYKPQFDEHAQWAASQIGSMDEWMYWNE